MPALPSSKPFISVDDYLLSERRSEVRHEYIDGDLYAMGEASDRHGLIVNALAFCLTPATRRQGCQLFTSAMKVRLSIADQPVFYYPDLLLSCDEADRATYYRCNPCLLVEVLSESTERIDRREKRLAYQTLTSLREYLMVAQDARRVEVYRSSNGGQPEYVESGAIWLECLKLSVSLDDIYLDVR